MPFPYVVLARSGAKPLEPFGKGSNALKAGTRDAGPQKSYRDFAAVRSAPGRGRAERQGLYACRSERQGVPRSRLLRLTPRERRYLSPLSGGLAQMSTALVFPGQGSQGVGMGKRLAQEFAAARAVFDEVDVALGEKLSATMWEGPADKLTLTENAQPALMAVSLAALRVLEAEAGFDLGRDVAFVAGHSLGEYSALPAPQSLTIADAARLLRTRGRAMQKAVPIGVGAMAALVGTNLDQAKAVAAQVADTGVCAAANDNGGGQGVLSGAKSAVERAVEIAKEQGVKRAMILPVSAPCHGRLRLSAAAVMAEALSQVEVRRPRVPLVANVLAEPISDPAAIVRALTQQVTDTVRWRESVLFMVSAGVTVFYEVGAGRVLTGLIRRIAEGATASTVGAPDDIAAFKTAHS